MRVEFRFYAELNDLLPPGQRGASFEQTFPFATTVKDAIEALGVPHSEVDLVLLDGESVGFEARLVEGARVAVYPVFESVDIRPVLKLRPEPLRQPRFVLDAHLGALASRMRMLGLDARWENDLGDPALAELSRSGLILLTRDRNLLKRRAVTHAYWVRSERPDEQLIEVLRRFDLFASLAPFTRCLRCNERLRPITAAELLRCVPESLRRRHSLFVGCPACGRVYWKGSHHVRMQAHLEQLLEQTRRDPLAWAHART